MVWGEKPLKFIGNADFAGVAGEVHYVQSSGDTFVEGDVNGDGNADFAIRLVGLHDLTAADLLFPSF
jgi:hypothetical protein